MLYRDHFQEKLKINSFSLSVIKHLWDEKADFLFRWRNTNVSYCLHIHSLTNNMKNDFLTSRDSLLTFFIRVSRWSSNSLITMTIKHNTTNKTKTVAQLLNVPHTDATSAVMRFRLCDVSIGRECDWSRALGALKRWTHVLPPLRITVACLHRASVRDYSSRV